MTTWGLVLAFVRGHLRLEGAHGPACPFPLRFSCHKPVTLRDAETRDAVLASSQVRLRASVHSLHVTWGRRTVTLVPASARHLSPASCVLPAEMGCGGEARDNGKVPTCPRSAVPGSCRDTVLSEAWGSGPHPCPLQRAPCPRGPRVLLCHRQLSQRPPILESQPRPLRRAPPWASCSSPFPPSHGVPTG